MAKTGKRRKEGVIITTAVVVAVVVVGVWWSGWEIPDKVTAALGLIADAFLKAARKVLEFIRTHRPPP